MDSRNEEVVDKVADRLWGPLISGEEISKGETEQQ